MKKALKNDIKLCINMKIIISILIALIPIIYHLCIAIKYQEYNDSLLEIKENKSYLSYYPMSIFNSAIVISDFSPITDIFYWLLPFMVSLPSSTILFNEKEHITCSPLVVTKIFSKIIVAFFSGMIMCAILLIICYWISAMFFPCVKPEIFTGYFPICNSTFGILYMKNPWLYVLIYSLIDIFYCGIFSALTATISHFCEHKFFCIFSPLILSIIYIYFCKYLPNLNYYNPFIFLNQSQKKFNLNLDIAIKVALGLIILMILINIIRIFYILKNQRKGEKIEKKCID